MIESGSMDLELCVGQMPGMQSFEEEIRQLQQEGLLDLNVAHDLPSLTGIEATDVGSLLEQFEEASQTFEECDSLNPTAQDVQESINRSSSGQTQGADTAVCVTDESENITPSKNVLDKIRAGSKRKAAIMLPMSMPSKRGRGRATSMSANCAPPKFQHIIKSSNVGQTMVGSVSEVNCKAPQQVIPVTTAPGCQGVSLLTDNLVSNLVQQTKSNTATEPLEVGPNYYKSISDHDYCRNVPHCVTENIIKEVAQDEKENNPVVGAEHVNRVNLDSCNLDVDDSVVDSNKSQQAEEQTLECVKRVVKHSSRFLSYQEKLKRSRMQRHYRKNQGESPDVGATEEKYFDKIPAYYTALSIPNKQKTTKETSSKIVSGAGITLEDYFERNPSPPRDPTVFNKLPAYYSCFTNSTKYDSSDSSNTSSVIELSDKNNSMDNSLDSSRICSSGYSSRSHTPSLVIDSRQCSRSPSPRSSSRSSSRSRSRSRSRSKSRGRKRSWRRERKSSYSSHSRSSSRSSYYSRSSASRSRSRSRSLSSDDSYSSSRSRSRSRQRTRSQERRRERQKFKREQEKQRQIEERRIVYVGRIPDKYSRHDMRERFGRFGEIEHVQLHFREHGDNYGFVTFAYTCDAYAAVEKGNDIPGEQPFDMCFGGRRQFCKTEYEDLDGDMEVKEEFNPLPKKKVAVDFDELLKQAQRKIQK